MTNNYKVWDVQKWNELQTIRYNTYLQPTYVSMGHAEENFIELIGYTSDAEKYFEWIKTAIEHLRHD